VAYVGDDLPDLPILERVGLAIAVANAAPEVKRAAHYVTRRRGGEGAVREAIETILKAQGAWRNAVGKARA
jgi:3-deoxy-D-manno-octulosonate 8-phosphate phosphatase (KDO 8-P phosphatase)